MTDDRVLAGLIDGVADEVVVILGDHATTRGELRTLVDRLGSVLRDHACAGHAIGVLLPNDATAIAAWFAAWNAGAAFVPLNPRVPATELARTIERIGSLAVVTNSEFAESLTVGGTGGSNRVDDTPFVIVYPRPSAPRTVDPGVAILQFTSGTTGAPKAVPLRHDTVRELLDSVIGSLRTGTTRARAPMPNLVPLSLAVWGGIYQVLFAFRIGAPVVLMDRFDPHEFARLVEQHDIRSSVLPPAALVMLVQDPEIRSLAPLRYVRSVSAPLSPEYARRFYERFGIAVLNGYGQTELGGEAIGWTAADWKQWGTAKLGAVGRPHAAFELRIRGDDGGIGAVDAVGELEIKSSSPLPDDDPALAGRVTADGWLRTGDLARIDGDGFVWIEGRISSMINRGGLKVFPDEVEEHLRAFPGILDVGVAGVPDERLGEVPWAFVVLQSGAELDSGGLAAWCREHLAPYKVPAGFTVVDALPRNEMGKLVRPDLAQRAPSVSS